MAINFVANIDTSPIRRGGEYNEQRQHIRTIRQQILAQRAQSVYRQQQADLFDRALDEVSKEFTEVTAPVYNTICNNDKKISDFNKKICLLSGEISGDKFSLIDFKYDIKKLEHDKFLLVKKEKISDITNKLDALIKLEAKKIKELERGFKELPTISTNSHHQAHNDTIIAMYSNMSSNYKRIFYKYLNKTNEIYSSTCSNHKRYLNSSIRAIDDCKNTIEVVKNEVTQNTNTIKELKERLEILKIKAEEAQYQQTQVKQLQPIQIDQPLVQANQYQFTEINQPVRANQPILPVQVDRVVQVNQLNQPMAIQPVQIDQSVIQANQQTQAASKSQNLEEVDLTDDKWDRYHEESMERTRQIMVKWERINNEMRMRNSFIQSYLTNLSLPFQFQTYHLPYHRAYFDFHTLLTSFAERLYSSDTEKEKTHNTFVHKQHNTAVVPKNKTLYHSKYHRYA